MAAANILVTEEVANRWKVPEERRVYLRGWGFARDAPHIASRDDMTSSPAMRAATAGALSMASMTSEEIDVFDLYSCFSSAVQFASDALDLDADDPRPISLTGGLPFHGGPGSNYMSHSISALVEDLRANPGRSGMVTGIGMHMTKHVTGIWSTVPGATSLPSQSPPLEMIDHSATTSKSVRDRADCVVTIESASAIYDRDGFPHSVIAVCSLDDETRCYARSDDPEVIATVAADEWVGASARVAAIDDGTNRLLI